MFEARALTNLIGNGAAIVKRRSCTQNRSILPLVEWASSWPCSTSAA
jgi:hypothetical protein